VTVQVVVAVVVILLQVAEDRDLLVRLAERAREVALTLGLVAVVELLVQEQQEPLLVTVE
jgi:hypothetical protein